MPDDLIPGVDYEPAVCCVCGTDEHTAEQLAECIDSALAPYLSCTNCGWSVHADRIECDSCGASL